MAYLKNQIVEWYEPWQINGRFTAHVRMLAVAHEIVFHQHMKASITGDKYDSDEDALQDFIVVYWARLLPQHNWVQRWMKTLFRL